MKRQYFVYILTGHARTLYTGVTNNLERRLIEHKYKVNPGFTADYNVNQLVHCEMFTEITQAIAREKQIKGWSRAKKIALIDAMNPEWLDLGEHLLPHPFIRDDLDDVERHKAPAQIPRSTLGMTLSPGGSDFA